MADKMRKTKGGKPPISQHPIFPAIIALWCGALAGLCSIALRPAVVEQAILATGLDTLVPMAAPPLGATFRIALALAMTGIGALLGGFLALRIVRPRPSARPRADRTEMARDQAPASVPAAERAPAGRRRALANMELEAASAQEASAETAEAQEIDAPEAAAPFAQPETAAPATASDAAPPEETEPGDIAEGILDMRAFDLDAYLDSAQVPAAEPDAMPAPSEAEAEAPDAPVALEDNVAPSRPIPPEAQVFRASAASASAPEAHVPAAPGQRLFDAYSQAIAARTAAPGFSLLPHKDEGSTESAQTWDDTPTLSEPTATDAPPSAETAPSGAPEVLPFAAAAMAEFTAGAGPRSGAERIAARELDELSPIELLERLALAMTRRRETEARDAAQETPEEATPAPSTSGPAIPEPYSPETSAEALQMSTPSAEEEATPPQVEAPEPTPVALGRGPFAAPNFEAARAPSAPEAAETIPDEAPAAKLGLPAAMRGIDFDAFEDEDDEALPDYIPARHIRAPAPPSAPSPAPFAAPAGPASAEAEENDDEEENVLEQGYSSLLGLSRPAEAAPSFVRVEEPDDHDEIEPVVIFPGEEARSQAARASSEAPRPFDPAPAGGSEPLAFPRQLQADASHAQPRPFDAPPREDAEETEKALRAALATLQRMSGAA